MKKLLIILLVGMGGFIALRYLKPDSTEQAQSELAEASKPHLQNGDEQLKTIPEASSPTVGESEQKEPSNEPIAENSKPKESEPPFALKKSHLYPTIDKLFPGAVLVEEKTYPPAKNGVSKQVFIMRTDLKYPLVRIEDQKKGKQVSAPRAYMIADHFMVQLKEGVSSQSFDQKISPFGAKVIKQIGSTQTYIVGFDHGESPDRFDEVKSKILALPETHSLEPDYVRSVN